MNRSGNQNDKPLVDVDDLERERAWDKIGHGLHGKLIESARSGENQEMEIVATILNTVEGARNVITYNAEYGDNDAINMCEEQIRSMVRNKLLRDGESLEIVSFRVHIEHMACRSILKVDKR
jgi:hypothetical protein